jgi:hypothetical protein
VSGEGRGKGSGSREAAPPEDSRYSNSTSLLLHCFTYTGPRGCRRRQ